MCELCRAPRLTRRRFLALSATTGLTVLLGACRPGTAPVAGRFGGRLATAAPLPLQRPHLAGPVAEAEGAAITVQAPLGSRTLASTGSPQLYDPSGSRLKALPPAMSAVLWLQDEQVGAVQQLPPLAATTDIPAELTAQPRPTGETRSLGPLTLITRAGWGGAAPQWLPGGEAPFDAQTNPTGYLIYPEPLAPWLNTLIVHHAALEFADGPRTIQRLHVLRNRFADVAYHFFIDGLGQLYEGRPLAVRGAHTGGYNTGTVGVCLLGNFELAPPIQAQLDTLQALAQALRESHTITHLAGHRDFQPDSTVCPGDNLLPLLPMVAETAGLRYGTEGYRPPPW